MRAAPLRLRTRIMLLTTGPLLVLSCTLLFLTHQTTKRSVESTVRQGLRDAELVFDEMLASQRRTLRSQAEVTARDPRFFATFSVPHADRGEQFAQTLQGVAEDFLEVTDATFLEVYSQHGERIARADRRDDQDDAWTDLSNGRASLGRARRGMRSEDQFVAHHQAVVVTDVPVWVAGHIEAVLRVGQTIDAAFLRQVSQLTSTSLILTDATRILCANREVPPALAAIVGGDQDALKTEHADYRITRHALGQGNATEAGAARVVIVRDVRQDLAPLKRAEKTMAGLGVATILATLAAAWALSVGVTGPLQRVVHASRELRRGNYEVPVPIAGNDEVGELGRSFHEMRTALHEHVKHLEDIDRIKSDFLALAGHELKTPLTTIISFHDAIHSGMLGELPDEVVETNQIVKEQLWRLNGLVQDILDLTQLEQQKQAALAVAPVNLSDLVQSIHARQDRSCRRVECNFFRAPEGLVVNGDARLLERAVSSLLDNAVKFTPDEGHVRVEISRTQEEAVLRVRDEGVGIEHDEKRWIFAKFYERGDIDHHTSGDLEFGSRGAGLGLALVQAIARAHFGRVDVNSQLGQGSTFTLTLPLAATLSPNSEAPDPVATPEATVTA